MAKKAIRQLKTNKPIVRCEAAGYNRSTLFLNAFNADRIHRLTRVVDRKLLADCSVSKMIDLEFTLCQSFQVELYRFSNRVFRPLGLMLQAFVNN